jgi:hypothetical protein
MEFFIQAVKHGVVIGAVLGSLAYIISLYVLEIKVSRKQHAKKKYNS